MAVCGIAVADDYIPVEFIVSTGSQYADTGVRLNPKLSRIDARFVLMEASTASGAGSPTAIAGAFYCSPHPVENNHDEASDMTFNNRSLCISYDKNYFYPNFVRSNNQDVYRCAIDTTISNHTGWWVHQMEEAWCFVNVQGNRKGWYQNTGHGYYDKDKRDCWVGTCYLGTVNKTAAYNDGEGAVTGETFNVEGERAKVKWYGFQITTNDVLQADLIPAKRTSDGTYGFYDRVRGTFHPSMTATPFVGPTICAWTPSDADDPLDASHFTDNVPQGKLDVISVPANAQMNLFSKEAVASLNGLGGLRLEEATTVCCFSNLTAGVTLQVPFYGKGVVLHQRSTGYLAFRGDSTSFQGRFTITNGCMTVAWPLSFGATNCVHIYQGYNNAGGYRVDFTSGGSVYRNEFHFESAYSSSQNSVIYSCSSGSEFAGPCYWPCLSQIWFAHGDVSYTWSGPWYPEGDKSSTIRINSKTDKCFFTGAEKDLGNNQLLLTSAGPSLGASFIGTTKAYTDTNSAMPSHIRFNNGVTGKMTKANAFADNLSILFNDNAGATPSGGLNLNGCDQQFGPLQIRVNDNKNYVFALSSALKFSTPTNLPATLTLRGPYYFGFKEMLTRYPGYYPGSFAGALSLVVDTKEDFETPAVFRIASADNTMSGEIAARRGTIELMEGSACSNLTALVTSGEGQLVVNTSDLGIANTNNLEIVACTNVAANTLPLTIGEGCSLTAKVAVVGSGRFLDAGVYTKANLPRYIAGDGELVVKEYGGPKGMMLIIR